MKFKNMSVNIGFNNGDYCLISDIRIPLENLAIGRSYAGFDFFRINKGNAFYLDRHLARLFNTIKLLKLKIDFSEEEIKDAINQLIVKNNISNFFMKIYVIPQNSSEIPISSDLYIIPCEMPEFSNRIYENGTNLLMKEYSRFLPEAKSTNYIASIFWQEEISAIQAVDVLFYQNSLVLECSRGNVFMVKDGKVYTPAENILKGITRSIVIDLLREENIPLYLNSISIEELLKADEVFISSTTKMIIPIVKINTNTIGNGKPGNIAKRISELFLNLLN
jgi:branched-chain amino acid aminotransferase